MDDRLVVVIVNLPGSLKMFPSSVIRKLARSEEMFAETHNFVGLGAHVKGPIDIDAMSDAFDALLAGTPGSRRPPRARPRRPHQIVVDDLIHPGIEVVELDDPARRTSAAALRPERITGSSPVDHPPTDRAQPTLYIHHSLADGHHQFSLIEELFSWYTDLVAPGTTRSGHRAARAGPFEVVLAERRRTETAAVGTRAVDAGDVCLRPAAIPANGR